ncbi:MAG TPA: hypothetical protein VHN19_11955 [Burkholderiales bacterium]|jgi:hypothetical protein|nr:hypothetical protein [Burkholderiales bacterium]
MKTAIAVFCALAAALAYGQVIPAAGKPRFQITGDGNGAWKIDMETGQVWHCAKPQAANSVPGCIVAKQY